MIRRSFKTFDRQLKMSVFDFPALNLIPKKCIVESRKECDTSILIEKGKTSLTFELPIIPANMECVINEELAVKLAENNFFYVLHRFELDVVEFVRKMKARNLYSSISIGVNDEAYEVLETLLKENLIPEILTIDIAHGHSIKMEKILKWIRSKNEFDSTFVIAGNIGSSDAVQDLEDWGADAIKVGVAPGFACTTYQSTGFGTREMQAFAIGACSSAKKNPRTMIIADGGIREPGDVAKAIVLGSDLVMIGGMFSGLKDSPGPTVTGLDGKMYKEFWGSASAFQSGKTERIEGTKKILPMQDKDMLGQMQYFKECLQSSISYGGGKKLSDLRNVEFIVKK